MTTRMLLPIGSFTGEEITALADTLDTAADDERAYILGSGGIRDYSDEEWPEVAEIKAARWELVAQAINRLGQTATSDKCEQLSKDIRATIDTTIHSVDAIAPAKGTCSVCDAGVQR